MDRIVDTKRILAAWILLACVARVATQKNPISATQKKKLRTAPYTSLSSSVSFNDQALSASSVLEYISPEFWPPEELDHYRQLNRRLGGLAIEATASGPRSAMAAVTVNALSAHIASKVLELNGTAADAAIAAACATCVLEHGESVSFAGLLNAVYYDAEKNETKVLHGMFRTIPENDPSQMNDAIGAQTGIPAFFAAIEALLETYGSGIFILGDLLAPSIWLAEQGYYDEILLLKADDPSTRNVLERTGFGRRLLESLEEKPESIPQPEVAAMLRNISKYGVGYMYTGGWATEAVAVLREWGSNITIGHLSDYYRNHKPAWQEPQVDKLTKGRTMYSIGIANKCFLFPTNMAKVIEMYNIMRASGMMKEGSPDFTNNATVLSYLMLMKRYVHFIDSLVNKWGLITPLTIAGAFSGLVAPVEENVIFFDPLSANEYRSSQVHAKRVWQAMRTPKGIDQINRRIDTWTPSSTSSVSLTRDGGSHSDGIVAHDRYGSSISLIHTIHDDFYGTGLFAQGVALPGPMEKYQGFLEGPWNDRSKSVTLPNGHQVIIITGSDGQPDTILTGVAQMHFTNALLVMLASGWGRRDVADMINAPFAWQAPSDRSPYYDYFNFLLFAKEGDTNEMCNEFCQITLPFSTDFLDDLEPWITPYVQTMPADKVASLSDMYSLEIGGYPGFSAMLRIQERSAKHGVTNITGAGPFWINGAADPVPSFADPVPSFAEHRMVGIVVVVAMAATFFCGSR